MPKSVTLARPSASISTFWGLTSRWTIWFWWAHSRARAISIAYATASSIGSRPMRLMRVFRVSPSTCSKTMYGRLSSSPASMTVTMCGWESWATARASRRKRSIWLPSSAISRCSSLMATGRSSVVSKARYTVDMPPAPIRASSR